MLDRRFLDVNFTIESIADTPDANPSVGTQYIVGSSPSGAFAGATANSIARYDGSAWIFTPAKVGSLELLNISTGEILKYNGTTWGVVSELGKKFQVVDTIVYKMGFDEITFPANRKDMRGKFALELAINEYSGKLVLNHLFLPNIYDDSYNPINVEYMPSVMEGELNNFGSRFFDFTNGKIWWFEATSEPDKYGVQDFAVYSIDFGDGGIFYNKEDGVLYRYDATNHNFIKVGGRHHFVIDAIFSTLETPLNNTNRLAANTAHNSPGGTYLYQPGIDLEIAIYPQDNLRHEFSPDPNISNHYIILNSSLTDNMSIYTFGDGGYYIRVITQLSDGDTIYNKFDGCTYLFASNTLTKIATPSNVTPVNDFILNAPYEKSNTALPTPTKAGDKAIKYTDNTGYKLYTATEASTWNSGENVMTQGDRYASLSTHKIYQTYFYPVDENYSNNITSAKDIVVFPEDIPVGASFLNKADSTIYTYDGTDFIASSSSGSSGSSGDEVVTETHTLIASEITNKSITLANSVKSGKEAQVLLFIAGLVQIAGTDFVASGNTISWNTKGLESRPVNVGDTLVIHYVKA